MWPETSRSEAAKLGSGMGRGRMLWAEQTAGAKAWTGGRGAGGLEGRSPAAPRLCEEAGDR